MGNSSYGRGWYDGCEQGQADGYVKGFTDSDNIHKYDFGKGVAITTTAVIVAKGVKWIIDKIKSKKK